MSRDVDQWIEQHYDEFRVTARAILGPRTEQDPTDLIHSALLKARSKLGEVTKPTSYLRRCVANKAIDIDRRRRRHPAHVTSSLGASQPTPHRSAHTELDDLKHAIEALRLTHPALAARFETHYVGQIPIEELADDEGVSVRMIQRSLSEARERIIEIVRQRPRP